MTKQRTHLYKFMSQVMIMCSTMSCSRLPPFYRPEHMIPHTSFCPSRISISLLKKSSLHTSLVCLYEKEEQEFRVFGLAWRCSFLVMQYGPICTPALQPQLPPWFHEQRLIEMIQLIAVFSEELSLATANTKVFDCLSWWISRTHLNLSLHKMHFYMHWTTLLLQ